MKSFQELNLPQSLSKALQVMKFEVPTPIQAQAIPHALAKEDLIGCAQTGTGKTAAFCIPLLVHLLNGAENSKAKKTGLILVPTRELAKQIEDFWKSLTRFLPEMRCISLIGGVPMQPQVRNLRKQPRVVIATPGRLLDHLNRRSVSVSQVEVLVLDEADRMLDMGFAPQLSQILKFLPKARQTLLFSATWSPKMDQLSAKYLKADFSKNPIRISVGTPSRAATKVAQTLIHTTAKQKNEALLDEINQIQGSILVFARTQVRTDKVAKYLGGYGLTVNRLHGGRTQGQRNTALRGFKSGEVKILVATDIAARGLDVSGIAHVINFDLPQLPEDYIHRIGRTARGGASGHATSFVTPEERGQWREIATLLKKSGSELPVVKNEVAPQAQLRPVNYNQNRIRR